MKRLSMICIVIIGTIILSSCIKDDENLNIQKVGMIMEGNIKDQPWDKKGYEGLQTIGEKYDVSVEYKEEVTTKQKTLEIVKKFTEDGVNLIFGHSNIYGPYFVEIAKDYPNVHFVYFNGGYFDENVTSLNFNSHAMGFFAGMVASRMTETKEVGIIAAYEWQQEIEGFYEGVKFQNAATKVHINFINNWNNKNVALEVYEEMRDKNVDVFYPAGDYFSPDIIERSRDEGVYTVGYLIDQSAKNESTVLTSTIQHVDQLYAYAAEKFNEKSLEGGLLTFDFQDGVITLGEFSPEVPEMYQKIVKDFVDKYIETNLLPNELN